MKPPRLILADAGNVRVVYKDTYRARQLAEIFEKTPQEVHKVIHQSEPFHALERGTITWAAFADYVGQMLSGRGRLPQGWSAEAFGRIWVDALTDPITPVIDILAAVGRHIPVVSASNVDERAYRVYERLPQARAMLRVHSESHFIGKRKGDPDYFEVLLAYVNRELGTDVQLWECVFIDDLHTHIVTAKGKGMQTVWFSEVSEGNLLQLKIDLLTYGVPDAWLP